jgi:hypothetical protein
MGTEVVTGERKSPYIYETPQIAVLNNHCELLADKEGQHNNTPDIEEEEEEEE